MSSFNRAVYDIVLQIPEGRVTTYGYLAAMCGKPRAARVVGGIAHYGPPELPWQRVVKSDGRLAEGFPGGVEGHRQVLEQEGVAISDTYKVLNFNQKLWGGDEE